ncbi:transporter substrate-binding domain-containing protein [Salirhabdus salicampi]|uniref:transporter substrate-binding domain-containing protein n=1 Tax=Salirhabdus salicampi TaxID=476102 RepID=UPI0020C2DC9E|nr:transporter substrate-binding domain-containing protein [Salirhabdus salicampi]MCP8617312.1 transporter substrate-binding domain-containing protein [Salirhabdus salicampi]
MKKRLAIILTLLLTILATACGTSTDNGGTGEQSKDEKKKLVMGTSADYPPFEYIDTKTGEEIIGFDVDLAKYITDQLGYELVIKDIAFDGLIGALQANRVDFVAACMSATEERKKSVDFSDIYFISGEMVLVRKDSGIEKVEDLQGKVLGVQLGSIQEGTADDLQEEITDLEVKKLNKAPELIQELKSKRIDGVVLDQTVAEGFLNQFDDLLSITLEVDSAGTAIAFPKDSELVDEFNTVIQEMKENGELDKLVQKWIAGEEKK